MKCSHNNNLPEIEKNSSHLSEKYEGKTNLVLIGSYYETEEFMKDNEYIKNGYRINCDSLWKCLKSLFVIHNESINIWSHLLGSIFMFFLIFYTMIFITSYKTQINIINFDFENIKKYAEPLLNSNNSQLNNFKKLFINFTQEFKKEIKMNFNNFNPINFYTNSLEKLNNSLNYLKRNTSISFNLKEYFDNINEKLLDFKEQMLDMMEIENIPINNEKFLKYKNKNLKRFPLFIILSSAILCLIFSVFFHLIGIISKNYYKILSKFDYAGISLLIAGSCYPPYYYFFYCSNFLRNFYLTFITTFGICVFFYSLRTDFYLPSKRFFRGILFLIFGISAGVPIVHISLFNKTIVGFGDGPKVINWYFGGFCYIFGAILYINRFPEKYFPGTFDIYGASHQLFHLFVLGGIIFHYFGSLDAYYYRFNCSCNM